MSQWMDSQQGSQSEDEAHQGTQLAPYSGDNVLPPELAEPSTSASDNLIDHNCIDVDLHHERVEALGNIVLIRGMIEEIGQVELLSLSWCHHHGAFKCSWCHQHVTEQIWVCIETLHSRATNFASRLESVLRQHHRASSAISADHYDTEFGEIMDKYNELKIVCAPIVLSEPRGLKRSASDP